MLLFRTKHCLALTMMALPAATNPTSHSPNIACLLYVPKYDDDLLFKANLTHHTNISNSRQHGTYHAIEIHVAKIPSQCCATHCHHDMTPVMTSLTMPHLAPMADAYGVTNL